MTSKAMFLSSSQGWHWDRQFPDGVTTWRDVDFIFSGSAKESDVVFVFDDLPSEIKIATKTSVFVASEPKSIKQYDRAFLSQFDVVLTTDESTSHPGRKLSQLGLPWHIGAWSTDGQLLSDPINYRSFESLYPKKTKSISVVASNKAYTPGHRARLSFAEKLKGYFGDEIDVFGRNIRGFGDKTEVLLDYRYHVAIENSRHDDYWTEKLSDTYLALTYPIYFGCSNIGEYFPSDSMTSIDIRDVPAAIRTIKKLIESDVAERCHQHLETARKKVLEQHNLFNIMTTEFELLDGSPLKNKVLLPEKHFTRAKKTFRRLLDGFRRMKSS